jgi:hypothetical protein
MRTQLETPCLLFTTFWPAVFPSLVSETDAFFNNLVCPRHSPEPWLTHNGGGQYVIMKEQKMKVQRVNYTNPMVLPESPHGL